MSKYKIHTKSNGTITAEANLSSPNAGVVGQSNTLTFWLESYRGDKTYRSDTTIGSGSTVKFASVTITSGTTLTVNGTLETHDLTVDGAIDVNGEVIIKTSGDTELSTLLEYSEWSGKYETNKMLDGTTKYTERFPSSEGIDSLVLGIEPSSDLINADVNGVWGLVDSISDQRGPTLDTNRVDISITVLAEFSDYTDHSSLESALKL